MTWVVREFVSFDLAKPKRNEYEFETKQEAIDFQKTCRVHTELFERSFVDE